MFNTIVPSKLITKLRTLGLNSPPLYSLFTHDCMARHDSNTIIKFANDTTVVGLITENNEIAYREEFRTLAVWCQDNNLFLNVIKTKEMIVDYRKKRAEHTPILINGAVVEQVKKFKIQIQSHSKLHYSQDQRAVKGHQKQNCRPAPGWED